MTKANGRIPAMRKSVRQPAKEPATPAPAVRRVVGTAPKPVAADTSQSRAAVRRVIAVAWLSILLGLLMQGLLLIGKVSVGPWPVYSKIFLNLVQGVTWSFFVCAGVGLGTTVAKSKAYLGGVVGMVAGPLAMGIAKGTQKLVGSILGVAIRRWLSHWPSLASYVRSNTAFSAGRWLRWSREMRRARIAFSG